MGLVTDVRPKTALKGVALAHMWAHGLEGR
jgi:hypothetical protein